MVVVLTVVEVGGGGGQRWCERWFWCRHFLTATVVPDGGSGGSELGVVMFTGLKIGSTRPGRPVEPVTGEKTGSK